MNKNISLLAVLALAPFATAALANGASVDTKNYFDGAYLGFGLGAGHTFTKNMMENDSRLSYERTDIVDIMGQPVTITNITTRNTVGDNENNLGKMSPNLQAFLGFGKTFSGQTFAVPFYLGAEIFGRYTPTSIKTSHAWSLQFVGTENVQDGNENTTESITGDFNHSFDGKLKNDYSLGGAARAGMLITPKTMFYILLGMDYARFTYDENTTITSLVKVNGTSIGAHTFGENYDFHSNKLAFMPGIGMETMLTDRLSLRAEYTYSFFGDIHQTRDIAISGTNLTTVKYKFNNIARGLFDLGVAYHFNGIN